MTSYCEPGDLLTGDMPVQSARAQQFIEAAADEIAIRLGVIYVWPPAEPLDPVTATTLKRLNMLLATGRLVMAQAAPGEGNIVHQYGNYLIKEGQEMLSAVANQEMNLPGVAFISTRATGNSPRIINADTRSGVDAFYAYANPLVWVPRQWGANT